jgi:hypothetical protein
MAALFLGACAEVKTADGDQAWQDRTYRTGSNLPTKHAPNQDGVATMSKEDMDRARDSSLAVPQGFKLPGGVH